MFDYPSPQVWKHGKIMGKLPWFWSAFVCCKRWGFQFLLGLVFGNWSLAHKSAYQHGIVVGLRIVKEDLEEEHVSHSSFPKQEDVRVCRFVGFVCFQRIKWKPHERSEMWIETCCTMLCPPYQNFLLPLRNRPLPSMQLHSWHQRQLQSLCCARPHPFPRMVRNEGHWRHCPQLADSLLVAMIRRFSGLPLSLREKGWRWLCTRYAIRYWLRKWEIQLLVIRSVPFENACTELYIPKLKASTENYDVTWCDIITQRIYLGSTWINHEDADSPKPPSYNQVVVKVQKTDGVTEIPYERWDVDEYFDPSPNAVGRIWAIWKCGVLVDHCWWTCWSLLIPCEDEGEDDDNDNERRRWFFLIIYAKEFIFAWLKGKISWWSTLPIYLQLYIIHGRITSKNLLFHFQNNAKQPNTRNKPKKQQQKH